MSTPCNVKLRKEAVNDLMDLSDEVYKEYLEMENKLKRNIHLGQALQDKNGKDLSDCFKLYFCEAKYRIVYRKKNNCCEVIGVKEVPSMIAEIIAVGKRDKEEVYKEAVKRLGRR